MAGGLGQCGLLFAITQLQVEKLPILLDVVKPFWFQVTEGNERGLKQNPGWERCTDFTQYEDSSPFDLLVSVR